MTNAPRQDSRGVDEMELIERLNAQANCESPPVDDLLREAAAALESAREDAGRLAKIGELIATQDNRITDSPIFIVQQKREHVVDPDYDSHRIVWVDGDNNEVDPDEVAQLDTEYEENGEEPDGFRRLAVGHTWDFVTACFTEQGCKDYLARDGHNLKEPRIYAAGSCRNEEYRFVRNHLLSFANRAQEDKP